MRTEKEICSPLLSVEEAAEYLGMSESWVYQRLRKFCPARKIGGKVKFLKADLDRFIVRSAMLHTETHMSGSLTANEAWDGKTVLYTK